MPTLQDVGKTQVAKTLAEMLHRPLIRLQCYEGLDVNSTIYERWTICSSLTACMIPKPRLRALERRRTRESQVASSEQTERFIQRGPVTLDMEKRLQS